MHQFFVNDKLELQKEVRFEKAIAHQIKTVLKLKPGEKILLSDTKVIANAVIQYQDAEPLALVEGFEAIQTVARKVTLIMALIRKEKFELVLQKATELGVYQIVPLILERNVVKWDDEPRKMDRYRSILKEASEQCHRVDIPLLQEPVTLKTIGKYCGDQNFVAYEAQDPSMTLKHQLRDVQSISIVIGPEGGISPREITELTKLGFQSVSLGSRIYRAETAAMAAIHTVDCILGL